MDCLRYHKKSP